MFSRAFISHSVHGGGWVGMSGPRSLGGWGGGGYTSGGRYTRGWVYQREVGIRGGACVYIITPSDMEPGHIRQAGGMHPTGMLSCLDYYQTGKNYFSVFP